MAVIDLLSVANPRARTGLQTILPKSTIPDIMERQSGYLYSLAKAAKQKRDDEMKDLKSLSDINTDGMRFNDQMYINKQLLEFDKQAAGIINEYRNKRLDVNEARIKIAGMKNRIEGVVAKSKGDGVEFDDWIKWAGQNADKVDMKSVMKIANDWSTKSPEERGTFPKEQLYSTLKKPFDLQKYVGAFHPSTKATSYDDPNYGKDATVADKDAIRSQVAAQVGSDTWKDYYNWGLTNTKDGKPMFQNETEAIEFMVNNIVPRANTRSATTIKESSGDDASSIVLPELDIKNWRAVTYSPEYVTTKGMKKEQNVTSLYSMPVHQISGFSSQPFGTVQNATAIAGSDRTKKWTMDGSLTNMNATFETIEYVPVATKTIKWADGTVYYEGQTIPAEKYDPAKLVGSVTIKPFVQVRVSNANRESDDDSEKYTLITKQYDGWMRQYMMSNKKFGKKGDAVVQSATNKLNAKLKATKPNQPDFKYTEELK